MSSGKRVWCHTCRRSQAVDNTGLEHQPTALGEQAWFVEWLSCGHSVATKMGDPIR